MSTQGDRRLGFATEAGRGNAHNQDKLGFYRPDDAQLAELAGSIYVVADAKGPGERGTALADLAIRQVVRAFYGAVQDYGRSDALAVAMLAADRALREDLEHQPVQDEAGVAMAALVVCGDEMIVGHVGSARAYLMRGGQAYRLTDEAADGAALLGAGPSPQPVISDGLPLGRGDRLLLCSDGLHQQLDEAAIARELVEHAPVEAAERLVAAAHGRAGWDDATAVVVAPFEPLARPATMPVVSSQEVSWPTVAIGATTLILLASLFIFRREILGTLAAGVTAGQTPTTVSQLVETPAPVASPTSIPVPNSPSPAPSATPTAAASATPTAAPRVKVPTVIGLTREDAEQVLRANYLTIDLIRLYSDSVAPGFIISQDPAGGTEVDREAEVQIAVSLGPAPPTATRFVPTAAPTEATAAPTELPTNAPRPPDDDDDDDPRPTDPPPPPPTDKPDPPTPKPDPGDPGSQGLAPPDGRLVRGLAAPIWPRPPRSPIGAGLEEPAGTTQDAAEAALARLDYHRARAGLFGLNRQAGWSAGAAAHARYMVRNDARVAAQDPTNAEHSPEGAAAAPVSLLALDPRLDRQAEQVVDDWLARPESAARALDPRLTVAGFGEHREEQGRYHYGAALDVGRGLQPELPLGAGWPLRYPAAGQSIMSVLVEWGGAWGPAPCSGFPDRTGPAVLLMLGPRADLPALGPSSLRTAQRELEHCLIDGSRSEALRERGAVALLPREPLRFGRDYDVSLELDGRRYQWSFRADSDDGPTPTPLLPPPTPTFTPTPTPTFTPTPTPTDTPTPTSTPTSTPTPTSTATNTPTATPTATPAPAYLPKLLKDHWLLCDPPWEGIDDPEPDSPGVVRTGLDLCPGMRYNGRLWLDPGSDSDDWFTFYVRRGGPVEIQLTVPPSGEGDYDLFLYYWQRGEYQEVGRSRRPAGLDEVIRVDSALAGRYWLRVWALGDEVADPYRLSWDYQ